MCEWYFNFHSQCTLSDFKATATSLPTLILEYELPIMEMIVISVRGYFINLITEWLEDYYLEKNEEKPPFAANSMNFITAILLIN